MKNDAVKNLSKDLLTVAAITNNLPSITVLMDKGILSMEDISQIIERVENDIDNVPKDWLLKEELKKVKKDHGIDIQLILADRLEQLNEKMIPSEPDAYTQRLEQLKGEYQNELNTGGNVERGIELSNEIQEMESNGFLPPEKDRISKMLPRDVVKLGVSFVTEYLNEFPDETEKVTAAIKMC